MTLERRIWWIGRVLAILLVIVSLRAGYWQLIRGWSLQPVVLDPVAAVQVYAILRGEPTPVPGSPEAAGAGQRGSLVELPQPVIQRTVEMLSSITRGSIFDRKGVVLAEDQVTSDGNVRVYHDISLAQTVGYTSALRTGVNGLEATYNDDLLGLRRPDTQIDRLLHRPMRGSDIVLTIDEGLQQVAAGSLGGRPGAIVVLEGKTGAVLSMVSAPMYDPNQVQDPNYLASLGSGALINRATQGLYTPGSIFKTVTLAAGLDIGQISPKTIFDFGEPRMDANNKPYYVFSIDGGEVIDPNHVEDKLDLEQSYLHSANAAFAKVGADMNPDTFIDYGKRFGFSADDYTRRFPLELPVAEPQLSYNLDDLRTNNLLRASAAYGQGELLTTPINMAMMVQAVVNDGSIPVPYFVEQIKDPQGNVIGSRPSNHVVRGVIQAKTARTTKDFMAALVKRYYSNLFGEGIVAGGKTGTAQLGGSASPHGWFVGYAQKGDQIIVISVIVENTQSGASAAVPIFADIANAYFSQ